MFLPKPFYLFLSPHPHDILHIIDYTHHTKGHHQSEACGGNWAGIFGKPKKDTCLYSECKERNVDGRRKNEDHSDGSADDTDNKGGNHRHLVAANSGLLMLMNVLDGIQSLGETGHEYVMVIEVGLLGEEKFLKCFVLCHNFSISFSLSRPRESCFFTASSEVSVMAEISLML